MTAKKTSQQKQTFYLQYFPLFLRASVSILDPKQRVYSQTLEKRGKCKVCNCVIRRMICTCQDNLFTDHSV